MSLVVGARGLYTPPVDHSAPTSASGESSGASSTVDGGTSEALRTIQTQEGRQQQSAIQRQLGTSAIKEAISEDSPKKVFEQLALAVGTLSPGTNINSIFTSSGQERAREIDKLLDQVLTFTQEGSPRPSTASVKSVIQVLTTALILDKSEVKAFTEFMKSSPSPDEIKENPSYQKLEKLAQIPNQVSIVLGEEIKTTELVTPKYQELMSTSLQLACEAMEILGSMEAPIASAKGVVSDLEDLANKALDLHSQSASAPLDIPSSAELIEFATFIKQAISHHDVLTHPTFLKLSALAERVSALIPDTKEGESALDLSTIEGTPNLAKSIQTFVRGTLKAKNLFSMAYAKDLSIGSEFKSSFSLVENGTFDKASQVVIQLFGEDISEAPESLLPAMISRRDSMVQKRRDALVFSKKLPEDMEGKKIKEWASTIKTAKSEISTLEKQIAGKKVEISALEVALKSTRPPLIEPQLTELNNKKGDLEADNTVLESTLSTAKSTLSEARDQAPSFNIRLVKNQIINMHLSVSTLDLGNDHAYSQVIDVMDSMRELFDAIGPESRAQLEFNSPPLLRSLTCNIGMATWKATFNGTLRNEVQIPHTCTACLQSTDEQGLKTHITQLILLLSTMSKDDFTNFLTSADFKKLPLATRTMLEMIDPENHTTSANTTVMTAINARLNNVKRYKTAFILSLLDRKKPMVEIDDRGEVCIHSTGTKLDMNKTLPSWIKLAVAEWADTNPVDAKGKAIDKETIEKLIHLEKGEKLPEANRTFTLKGKVDGPRTLARQEVTGGGIYFRSLEKNIQDLCKQEIPSGVGAHQHLIDLCKAQTDFRIACSSTGNDDNTTLEILNTKIQGYKDDLKEKITLLLTTLEVSSTGTEGSNKAEAALNEARTQLQYINDAELSALASTLADLNVAGSRSDVFNKEIDEQVRLLKLISTPEKTAQLILWATLKHSKNNELTQPSSKGAAIWNILRGDLMLKALALEMPELTAPQAWKIAEQNLKGLGHSPTTEHSYVPYTYTEGHSHNRKAVSGSIDTKSAPQGTIHKIGNVNRQRLLTLMTQDNNAVIGAKSMANEKATVKRLTKKVALLQNKLGETTEYSAKDFKDVKANIALMNKDNNLRKDVKGEHQELKKPIIKLLAAIEAFPNPSATQLKEKGELTAQLEALDIELETKLKSLPEHNIETTTAANDLLNLMKQENEKVNTLKKHIREHQSEIKKQQELIANFPDSPAQQLNNEKAAIKKMGSEAFIRLLIDTSLNDNSESNIATKYATPEDIKNVLNKTMLGQVQNRTLFAEILEEYKGLITDEQAQKVGDLLGIKLLKRSEPAQVGRVEQLRFAKGSAAPSRTRAATLRTAIRRARVEDMGDRGDGG